MYAFTHSGIFLLINEEDKYNIYSIINEHP